MTSDKQNFTISLNDDNSFSIIINKLNDDESIKMINFNDVPVIFSARFDDVDEYEKLIDE